MLLSHWLKSFTNWWNLGKRRTRRRDRQPAAHKAIERIEPRVLLSATASGPEFQVNTYTSSSQSTGAMSVASDPAGDFVVAWQSYGQDGSTLGVYAQRYNAAGTAQGAEFRVNSYTTGSQRLGSVAMDAVGDFVIVWESANPGGNITDIYAQRYNAAGVAQGGEFRVNTYTAQMQNSASVAMDAEGDFVVTWTSYAQDGSSYGIYAQRYDASGTALDAEFQVNTYTTSYQVQSRVAMNAAGDFVISWKSYGQDGDAPGIFGQRYNAAGVAQGTEFQVNTYTTNFQAVPTIAMDEAGDFIIAWSSYGNDGDGYGIFAQRYNPSGAPQGTEFQVNTYTTSSQSDPVISVDADGDFVVAWTSYGQDGSSLGIYARRYDAEGTAQGNEFLVNTYTTLTQMNPSVAMDAAGDFVVVWTNYDQDGSITGVFAQRYTVASDTAGPIVGGVYAAGSGTLITEGQSDLTSIAQVVVTFSENMNTTGGASGANSVTNPANWSLVKNGVDVSGQIASVSFGYNATTNRYEATLTFSAPLDAGRYVLTAKQSLQDTNGNALDGALNGQNGSDFSRAFSIPEFRVSTFTNGDQQTTSRAVAMDATGNYVVTWTSYGEDGSGYGIYAQRYNAAGSAVGSEFRVNTYTTGDQTNASAAMDAVGDFVIVWQSTGLDGSGRGVIAQRYNAAGVAQGNAFQVNQFTTGDQRSATVAMDAAGDFVITWTSSGQDGSGNGIFARQYNAAGLAVGNEFRVNSYTTGAQDQSIVAMDGNGDFVVAWHGYGLGGSGYDIYAQRYNAAGVAQGTQFLVNTYTTANQYNPSASMDLAGDFVISWMSNQEGSEQFGIYAQRFDAAGVAQGSEFHVNTFTTNNQIGPSTSMDANGDFIVTWSSFGEDGFQYGIYAQKYTAAGVAEGNEFRVNTTTTRQQKSSSVAMDADGDFVVAWLSNPTGGSYGVYARSYASSSNTAGPIVAGVFIAGENALITAGAREIQTIPQLVVTLSEDMDTTGGTTGAHSVTNPANWGLTRNGIDVGGQIASVTFGYNGLTDRYEATLTFTTPLDDGSYELIARQTLQDAHGNALDGAANGTNGSDFSRAFTVGVPVAVGTEFQVDTNTANSQSTRGRSVARDANGDFVVTWGAVGLDGDGYGIYAQRFNAAGVPQGSEFLVNTWTTGSQVLSAVAMDADGDFVITWQGSGQDGSGYGIFAQRYNAAGVAQGGEFAVNTSTTSDQRMPTIAMDAAGDFVIAWQSQGQDGSGYGVYAQRYNSAGVARGGEFRVNTYTTSIQNSPTVAMDAAGDFVISWVSYTQDGSNSGIYAQRYDAVGFAQGSEFRVNTFTTDNQYSPAAAMDADGDFVIVWESIGQDGSGFALEAQRYNALGVPQGGEFQVNSFTTGSQRFPSASMDANGDFIVAWSSYNQDGDKYGIYAQRYNAAGTPQGTEFQVSTYTTGNQNRPSVAMDAVGDFVAVWTSPQGGANPGIYSQLYGPAPFGISTSTLSNWTQNRPGYDQSVGVTGTVGAITYTLDSGALPAGLNLDSGTGAITGTPTATGPATFTIRVTDSASNSTTQQYTVTINAPVSITTSTLASGIQDQAGYSQTIATSQGTGPLTFGLLSGTLPGGLNLNSSTGEITGNPTAAGDYSFTIQVTDNAGSTASQAYSLKVYPPTFVVTGSTLDINASAETNAFIFNGGTTQVVVTVNGISRVFALSSISTFNFHGLSANDAFTFVGASGDDTVSLTPHTLYDIGVGYTVQALGMQTITAFGGGGNDRAYLFNSNGSDDAFVGTAGYAQLTGAGFTNTVYTFGPVTAFNQYPNAGAHTATLYTSTGTDSYLGYSDFSRMYGTSFDNRTSGYTQVIAVNSDTNHLGTHTAFLITSATDDTFVGTSTYAQLYGANFSNLAIGFPAINAVNADTNPNTVHAALLYGSAGLDVFVGTTTYGQLSGEGFSNTAYYFKSVSALATEAGEDVAYLYGSSASDTFIGTSTYGQLMGTTFNNIAYNFSAVYMLGAPGNAGTVYLYDSVGNDAFYGRDDYGVLCGAGSFNKVKGFGKVFAYSTSGGQDKINVDGSLVYTLDTFGSWQ